ncbi:MAG: AAA family ATPase, partial [Gammaproteobacteria bacterium]|nr:AAA family ATPase [Gammaproteobacteria bacterium]
MELQGNPISGDAIHNKISQCRSDLSTQIIGQERLLERLLIALLSDGHLIVEGAPGLAKTTAIKALANSIDAEFQRIQFTPDLLPSDLTGTEIYRPQTSEFVFQ